MEDEKTVVKVAIIFCLVLVENASLNAGNVSELNRQNLSKYSAGPCE